MKIIFKVLKKWMIGLTIILLSANVKPLLAQSGINDYGSFEQDLPSYWTKGSEPGQSESTPKCSFEWSISPPCGSTGARRAQTSVKSRRN